MADYSPATTSSVPLSGEAVEHAQACIKDHAWSITQINAMLAQMAALQAQVNALVALTGTVWHNGTGLPADSLGKDGDYYLDVDTGNVYVKENGSWV